MKKCNYNHPDHQMRIHYEELYNVALEELKASWFYISQLLSILDEVELLNKDILINTIIKNWLERYNLDKLIHARILFDN